MPIPGAVDHRNEASAPEDEPKSLGENSERKDQPAGDLVSPAPDAAPSVATGDTDPAAAANAAWRSARSMWGHWTSWPSGPIPRSAPIGVVGLMPVVKALVDTDARRVGRPQKVVLVQRDPFPASSTWSPR